VLGSGRTGKVRLPALSAVVLALLAAALQPAPAQARDPFAGIPNLSFRYYEVRGTNSEQINASMRARGPHSDDGGGAGSTDYRIGYSWGEKRLGSRCQVIDAAAAFAAIVDLPRLVDEATLSEPVQLGWRKLMATLRTHEAGHARIAYDHADEVRAAVAGARCGKEKARARVALDRIYRLQLDYDRRTSHGLAQGNIGR
jgi:predicted secreted Zn-dependent protease